MDQAAVLLMDLQRDFLSADDARMPVDAIGAAAVLRAANAVLTKRALAFAVPVLIVNQFPASARIANFFRRGAAVAGTPGSELDPRLCNSSQVKVISKSSPSAFTNPELESYLQAQGVTEIYVMGVFAEGCVRATVLEARRRGYKVNVVTDAIATNARWKKQFALWAMKRCGATLLPTVVVENAY